jgi:hypothetical protein
MTSFFDLKKRFASAGFLPERIAFPVSYNTSLFCPEAQEVVNPA